jgi:putative transposase
LLRVERAFQAFFQRIRDGGTPGCPRFQGRNRYNSFTYPQVGEHGGARLDNGFLVLSKMSRIAVRWSRPLEGTPKTVTISREADGWYVCFSCADIPVQPLPPTGQQTAIDLGIEAFATLSDGARIFSPGWYRKAERALKTAQRRLTLPRINPGDSRCSDATTATPPRRACPARSLFLAALWSRWRLVPPAGQECQRTDKPFETITPQPLPRCEGYAGVYAGVTATTSRPAHAAL